MSINIKAIFSILIIILVGSIGFLFGAIDATYTYQNLTLGGGEGALLWVPIIFAWIVLAIYYAVKYLNAKGGSKWKGKEVAAVVVIPLLIGFLNLFATHFAASLSDPLLNPGLGVSNVILWMLIIVPMIMIVLLLEQLIISYEAFSGEPAAINNFVPYKQYWSQVLGSVKNNTNIFVKKDLFFENLLVTKRNIYVIQMHESEKPLGFLKSDEDFETKVDKSGYNMGPCEMMKRIDTLVELIKADGYNIDANQFKPVLIEMNAALEHRTDISRLTIVDQDKFKKFISDDNHDHDRTRKNGKKILKAIKKIQANENA